MAENGSVTFFLWLEEYITDEILGTCSYTKSFNAKIEAQTHKGGPVPRRLNVLFPLPVLQGMSQWLREHQMQVLARVGRQGWRPVGSGQRAGCSAKCNCATVRMCDFMVWSFLPSRLLNSRRLYHCPRSLPIVAPMKPTSNQPKGISIFTSFFACVGQAYQAPQLFFRPSICQP